MNAISNIISVERCGPYVQKPISWLGKGWSHIRTECLKMHHGWQVLNPQGRKTRFRNAVRTAMALWMEFVFVFLPVLVGLDMSKIHEKYPDQFKNRLGRVMSPLEIGGMVVIGVFVSILSSEFFRVFRSLALVSEYQKIVRDNGRKEIALQLIATDDWNGVFRETQHELDILRQVATRYDLIRREISIIEQINDVIAELALSGKKIRLLWLGVHGDPEGVRLGSDISGRQLARHIQFSQLAKDAVILLNSCRTGAPGSALNVSDQVRLAAGPHQRVIAPKIAPPIRMVKLLDLEKCQFAFRDGDKDFTNLPDLATCKRKIEASVIHAGRRHAGRKRRLMHRICNWFRR